jgi:Tfp pilus assembly protein PilF
MSVNMAAVCHNMGYCYMKLSQFGAAEEALSHANNIQTAILPRGHKDISMTERALHEVWQLKFGRW